MQFYDTRQQPGLRKKLGRWFRTPFSTYLLFILIMLFKLVVFHYSLNVVNIDMNPVDYIVTIGSLLLVSFWTLWLPRKGTIASLAALNLLVTGIIYADLVFYRYFEDFITVPILMQAGQVGSLGDSIRSLIHIQDLWFFLDWIVVIPWSVSLLIRSRRSKHSGIGTSMYSAQTQHKKPFKKRLAIGLFALVMGSLLTFLPIKWQSKTWAIGLFDGNWWNLSLYNVTGLIGFHGYDTYRYAKDHFGIRPSFPQSEIDQVQAWFDDKRKERIALDKDDTFGRFKDINVIIVQVEALMNFVIGKELNGQPITPNLNALMDKSMYFSNFYHQTALGRTSDADFVTQTSLLPLPAGSVFTRFPSHTYDSMPSILKKNGYAANVYHSYDSSFWNRQVVYTEMEYDRFYSKKDFEQDEKIGWSISDASFFRQSLDYMKETPQPFYSFLITLSSHHPYSLPQEYRELDAGAFSGNIFGDYLQSVHYADKALGQMMDQLKAQGLWDNSILVIYGDHDNSITDRAFYEQFYGRPLSDLDMEQIMHQVPMLIHLPDDGLAGTYEEPAGMMHTAPTLYHLLGISTEPYDLMGSSLTSKKNRLVPLRSGAFSDDQVFFIPSETGSFESGACYSLKDRQPTDTLACAAGHEKSRQMLNISDQVVTYDLLAAFRESALQDSQE
ncbi:LTA synthase family protein [Paenibacillus lemnae]|uniref:LTA synthase family protein n=1 Tax=Paenibacillus lemnae TaxID=1330551 RepID=A0A848M6E4_PAELE|nr:LTA synthase family protein [Paenibacillus lemnae]NMO95403.1 LTA synthase family protein [Paenibacillus lemnae]